MHFREPLDLLPLRQTFRPATDGLALFSRREGIIDWLSRPDKYELHVDGHRVRVYAANQAALADARELITAAQGELATFDRPEVNTDYDEEMHCTMQPIMFVRVDVPRAYASVFVEELKRRCANVEEVSLQMHRAVIRAEVPLIRLVDLEEQLDARIASDRIVLSWLVRYQPADARSAFP